MIYLNLQINYQNQKRDNCKNHASSGQLAAVSDFDTNLPLTFKLRHYPDPGISPLEFIPLIFARKKERIEFQNKDRRSKLPQHQTLAVWHRA